MKTEQLQAIKERVESATSGEWNIAIAKDSNYAITSNEAREYVATYLYENDAEFIAHARQDVPMLIAEVERLQQALESVETACYSESNYIEIAKMARQALEGEQND